jgi:hypothetical protein
MAERFESKVSTGAAAPGAKTECDHAPLRAWFRYLSDAYGKDADIRFRSLSWAKAEEAMLVSMPEGSEGKRPADPGAVYFCSHPIGFSDNCAKLVDDLKARQEMGEIVPDLSFSHESAGEGAAVRITAGPVKVLRITKEADPLLQLGRDARR